MREILGKAKTVRELLAERIWNPDDLLSEAAQ